MAEGRHDAMFIAQRWVDAFNQCDDEGMLALYHPDVVYRNSALDGAWTKADLAAARRREHERWAEARLAVVRAHRTEEGFVLQVVLQGRARDGSPLDLPICEVFALEGDLIIRQENYFNPGKLGGSGGADLAEPTVAPTSGGRS